MKCVVPVVAAVLVEMSVHWNVEIQHQLLFMLPTIATDATRRESARKIMSDTHRDNDTHINICITY